MATDRPLAGSSGGTQHLHRTAEFSGCALVCAAFFEARIVDHTREREVHTKASGSTRHFELNASVGRRGLMVSQANLCAVWSKGHRLPPRIMVSSLLVRGIGQGTRLLGDHHGIIRNYHTCYARDCRHSHRTHWIRERRGLAPSTTAASSGVQLERLLHRRLRRRRVQ